ncbi:MAG TPA: metal ABC transporter substrate-binding protein [Bacilli bacterium]|nr:metal ABC transporter substrate-binding protein [Bacilli bacterium]
MKKIISLLAIIIIAFSLTGCFKRDELDDVTIYTTVYPIEYLVEQLYGNNSEVLSIYPGGVNPSEYTLTEKQIKDYSKAALFVYNGLSDEKQIAAEFINQNKDLKIIDVSQGITINYDVEELWLSPANYLMLAQNIKNQLKEYIDNKYIKEEIDENYDNFKLTISEMDAELKIIAENATNKTLIVSDDTLKFLEKYGFEVISLEGDISTTDLNKVKNLIKNEDVSFIFVKENEDITDTITNLTNTYDNISLVSIKAMTNLTEEETKNNENYITLMKENIEAIKNEAYE